MTILLVVFAGCYAIAAITLLLVVIATPNQYNEWLIILGKERNIMYQQKPSQSDTYTPRNGSTRPNGKE
jgi:hypothetical protein